MGRRSVEAVVVALGAALACATLLARPIIDGANESVCWSESAACAVSLGAAVASLVVAATLLLAALRRKPRIRHGGTELAAGRGPTRARVVSVVLVPVLALVAVISLSICDPPRNRECRAPHGVAAASGPAKPIRL